MVIFASPSSYGASVVYNWISQIIDAEIVKKPVYHQSKFLRVSNPPGAFGICFAKIFKPTIG